MFINPLAKNTVSVQLPLQKTKSKGPNEQALAMAFLNLVRCLMHLIEAICVSCAASWFDTKLFLLIHCDGNVAPFAPLC